MHDSKSFEQLKYFLAHEKLKIIFFLYSFDFFTYKEQEIILNEVKNLFSEEIVLYLRIIRKNFPLELELLSFFYEELKQIYEPECNVILSEYPNKEQKKEIEEEIYKLQEIQNLNFYYNVDSNIIDGLIFKLNNVCFDGSLNNIVNKLRKEVENEFQKI